MAAELVLTVLQDRSDALGPLAALDVADEVIIATVGDAGAAMLASHDARAFAPRTPPPGAVCDVLATTAGAMWACGERGQLAVSRDRGATWTAVATGVAICLRGLACASDGAVWVVGDAGFAARWLGDRLVRVELGTTATLTAAYPVRDEVVVLASDGLVRRWRNGDVVAVSTGAPAGLIAMAVTRRSWIVVGGGGFVGRSPDGVWFSRATGEPGFDLEGVAALPGGEVVAVGGCGQIAVSDDDGRSWRRVASPLTANLRAVERFGRGALIGGDGGLVARLAPADDDGARVAMPDASTTLLPVVTRPAVEIAAVAPVAIPTVVATPWPAVGDASARRALMERVGADAAGAAQLARLVELVARSGSGREAGVGELAGELASDVEALLVAAIAHGEARADGDRDRDGDRDEDTGDVAPGWDAIDRALEPLYHGVEPTAHFGTTVPFGAGGNDPIHGVSVYARDLPVPHFHFVTYGFTDLFYKETDDPEDSGFGFELTFRLAREPGEEVPSWAPSFLQNLGRYVFGTGNRFAAGHKMGLNGPIALGDATAITAVCFADDPELGDIAGSPFGAARFVQVVGITDDEYTLIQEWSTTRLVDMLRERSPLMITELRRRSLLDDPATAAEIRRLVDAEGSSEDLAFAGDMAIAVVDGAVAVTLGALYAATLPRAMRGRLRHGRPYELRGRSTSLGLQPGEVSRVISDDGDGAVELALAPALIDEIETTLRAAAVGRYGFDAWPRLTIEVTASFIRDQAGNAIDVRGVADGVAAAEMIAAENARLAATAKQREAEDEADGADEDDDDDDGDDDGDGEPDEPAEPAEPVDDAPPAPERIERALAMTDRALRLAPDDDETQFTHGVLLIDAARAGLPGKLDSLLALLPTFGATTRLGVALRLGRLGHPRFAEAVDAVLGDALPSRILEERAHGAMHSFGDVADELLEELAGAVVEHAPDRLDRLVARLPDKLELLAAVAIRAAETGHHGAARVLYARALALPLPAEGEEREHYLRVVNNACIHAHAVRDFATAVAIADRAQPYAAENPYIFHSAACAYAAVGDLAKALRQVELAIEHRYPHLDKLEVDSDLGALLGWPQFQALFRDWHAAEEGN